MNQVLVLLVALASPLRICSNPLGGISETTRDQDSAGNYNFGYNLHGKDGQQQFRHESRDLLGRVVGSYGLTEPDGRQRIVDYIADHNGFRARIRSNEPGLQGIDSAGVVIVKPEDAPPPLIIPQVASHNAAFHDNPGISSDLPIPIRGPYVSDPQDGNKDMSQQQIKEGESTPLFLPLPPNKPYITQSEGLYIPPQALDDLNYSPSGQRGNSGFRPQGFQSRSEPAERRLQLGNIREPFNREALLESDKNENKVAYPETVFELANSEERYGKKDNIIPDRPIRYRIVHIPNGIQAVPEYDPAGIGGPFPSAMNAFGQTSGSRQQYPFNPYDANRSFFNQPDLRNQNYIPRSGSAEEHNLRTDSSSERPFEPSNTGSRTYPRLDEPGYVGRNDPINTENRNYPRTGNDDRNYPYLGHSGERANNRPGNSDTTYPRSQDRNYPRLQPEEPIYQRPETNTDRIYQRPEEGSERVYQQHREDLPPRPNLSDRRYSIPRNVDGERAGSNPGNSHENIRGHYGQRIASRDYDSTYGRNYRST